MLSVRTSWEIPPPQPPTSNSVSPPLVKREICKYCSSRLTTESNLAAAAAARTDIWAEGQKIQMSKGPITLQLQADFKKLQIISFWDWLKQGR